jgi:DNA polymerase-3 subunit gamma/tau
VDAILDLRLYQLTGLEIDKVEKEYAELLERIRDLIVLQRVPGAAEAGLIHAPQEVIDTEIDQANRMGAAELARAGDLVSRSLSDIKGATAPRLQLELLMAKLLLPAVDDSTEGLRARIDQLERGAIASPATPAPITAPNVAAVVAPAPTKAASVPPAPKKLSQVAPKTAPVPKPAPAPSSDSPGSAGTATLSSFTSMWPAVMDALLKYSRVAWMGFTESTPLSFENGVLAVGVKDAGRYNNVKGGGHDERLRQAILDVLQIDCSVDIVQASVGGAGGAGGGGVAAAAVVADDTPELDDQTTEDLTGALLIAQELGGVQIGEIEHG